MTVNLLDCDICGTLEPRCRRCQQKEAYQIEDEGAVCVMCQEDDGEPLFLSAPLLDPNGQCEAHYCHERCLPSGSIPCREL